MITRREFGRLGLGVAALAQFSPFSLISDSQAQNVSAPGEGLDIRRVGVRRNGVYWGRGEEKIDLLSGNLSFSIPLVRAKSRKVGAAVRCSYNSQLWKYASDGVRSSGIDLGVGFGWKLQIASIVRHLQNGQVQGYTYIDSTGAEYQLIPDGSVWRSLDGHYVTWNPAQSLLQFANGSSFSFGCTAGLREADAGTLYPTVIEDSNGNQILITYLPGLAQAGQNSSSRIAQIEDARAGYAGSGQYSYLFIWSAGALPHLMSITNAVSTGESYTFSYSSQNISSPFGSNSSSNSQIATVLEGIGYASGQQRTFAYNQSGELIQTQLPHGGNLAWTYRTFTFQNGQAIREVSSRSLSDPWCPTNSSTHSFDRDPSDGDGPVHGSAILNGPTSTAQTQWMFVDDPGSPDCGMLSAVEDLSGGSVVRQKSFSWSRTTTGIPYIATRSVTLDPGTSAGQTATWQFSRDSYGNLTSRALYDYGSSDSPSRIITHTYLNDEAYIARHILNRRLSTTVQGSGGTFQTRTKQYDTTSIIDRPGLFNHDSQSFGSGTTIRGNATETYVRGVYKRIEYDVTGKPASVQDSVGGQMTFVPAEGTNNTLLGMILPNGNQNLAVNYQYQSGKTTLITKPDGAQTSISYDSLGRPTTVVSPSGAIKSLTYAVGPSAVTGAIDKRWATIILDGFGRQLQRQLGDDSGAQRTVQRQYGPAAHARSGKLIGVSLPYASGNSPQWVMSSYDDLGRKISQDLASTGAPKQISYTGNSVTVTDPAGRWKKVERNAARRVVKVSVPGTDGTSTLDTHYTYNALGELTGVTMPRSNGTQTRRFVYDASGRVIMRHQAESGKESRAYNSDGTLASYTDAKGQSHVYTRDAYKRIVSVKRYDPSGALQPNDSYAYYYDTSPFDSSFSANTQGRLAAVQWGSPDSLPGLVTEMYSYTVSGEVAAKRLRLNRGTNDADLEMYLSYDDEGRPVSLQYPTGGPTLTYSYDSMRRLNGVISSSNSIVRDVVYNPLGQLKAMKLLAKPEGLYLAQRYEYSSRNRIQRIAAASEDSTDPQSAALPTVHLEYAYRPDDGKLLLETDHVAGTTVSYAYDNQSRLASAESSDSSWGLSFAYDGFGNRISQQVIKGQGYSQNLRFDPTTNWILSDDTGYDANGNMLRLPGMLLTYDAQNRLIQAAQSANGTEQYGYDHRNLRIWKRRASGAEILTFYAGTKRLATYRLTTDSSGNLAFSLRESNVYFGKRMVQSGGEVVVTDRRGATRAWSARQGAGSTNYFPFGEEIRRTRDTSPKFGGYIRDAATGLDYAEQRYYSSAIGRFLTPDPYAKSAHLKSPGTWNRYAFVSNDPINRVDPHGLNSGGTSGGGGNNGGGGNSGGLGSGLPAGTGNSATAYYSAALDAEVVTNGNTSVDFFGNGSGQIIAIDQSGQLYTPSQWVSGEQNDYNADLAEANTLNSEAESDQQTADDLGIEAAIAFAAGSPEVGGELLHLADTMSDLAEDERDSASATYNSAAKAQGWINYVKQHGG